MTTTQDRDARLAALQNSEPPSTQDESAKLLSQLAELRISVEVITSGQKRIAAAVNLLLETPPPPDHSTAIETLTGQVKTLSGHLEALASSTTQPATDSAATHLDLAKTVGTAVDAAMKRAQHNAVPAREREVSEDLRVALVTADKLSKSLTSAAWGRLALATLPYTVVAFLLWTLVVPITEVVGIGPLSRWAWSSFDTAETAEGRLLVVVATFAMLAVVGYGIYRGGRHLAAIYQGWR